MPGVPYARASAKGVSTYLLFALTGVGLVLPGTLLPRLAPIWGAKDGRSGLLFFLFFVGTSLGALAARGSARGTLALATLTASSSVLMLDSLHGLPIFVAMLAYGFGLGLAMTVITLLRSRLQIASRRAELTRLNLVWAIGACLGPLLLLRTSTILSPDGALRWYAGFFLFSGSVITALHWHEPVPRSGTWHVWRHMRDLPTFYSVCLPLVTGIEASVGTWITTYSVRAHFAAGSVISSATSLWTGLLLSRLLFSREQSMRERQTWTMPLLALLPVLGLASMLGGLRGPAIAGTFCIGFGVGPLYPYLLSRLLDRSEAGNAGFLAAGAGSSLMPLMLGQLAQISGSLRLGLLVPASGAVVLAAALFWDAGARK